MIEVRSVVDREVRLAAPLGRAWALLRDVPAWGALFPRVASVAPLPDRGPDVFAWRMEPMGPPGGRVAVAYACRYHADPEAHRLAWTPVAGVGNAAFAGACRLWADGDATAGTLRLDSTLQIPAPRFARPLVQATLPPEMGRMTDTFLRRLDAALGAADGPA